MPRWSKEELLQKTLPALKTSDRQAMPLAGRLLNFLQQLPTRPERCVLLGQHIGSTPEQENFSKKYIDGLFAQTGRRPALIGGDYLDWDGRKDRLSQMNQTLLRHWKDGALITLSWHAANPWNEQPFDNRDIVDFEEILQAGSVAQRRWKAEVEGIAQGLAQLQDAGVVVLWRPFHEMNGGWFWWGKRETRTFVALWREMWRFFTEEKKLHNLLWVYAPNAQTGSWIAPVMKYYPGDDVVDIVALDAYHNEVLLTGYNDLVATGKPFGLSEFGPEESKRDGTFDNRLVLNTIRQHYPETRFVLFWNGWEEDHLAIVENSFARELMLDPWSLTRSMLPPH